MGRAGSGALPSSPDPAQGMIMKHRQQLHRMQKLNITRQHKMPKTIIYWCFCLLPWLWCLVNGGAVLVVVLC